MLIYLIDGFNLFHKIRAIEDSKTPRRDLVPRGWITQEEYLQGLAFAQMMPGPLAGQLAMWIGFIRHGVLGASLVGLAFILPAFIIVAILGKVVPYLRRDPLALDFLKGVNAGVIALMLGAFFMATDMVTTPMSAKGMIIFGLGCGVITTIIRVWGAYPEGVSFAILIMNAATPLINLGFKPKKFGEVRNG